MLAAIVHFADGTAERTIVVQDGGRELDALVAEWRELDRRFLEDGTDPGYSGIGDFLRNHGVDVFAVRHITASTP